MKRFEKLTAYIGDFGNDGFGEWIIDRENDGSVEHPKQIPFVNYSEMVHRLKDDICSMIEERQEMHLDHFGDILETWGIEWDFDSMTNADVSFMDGQGVMALLVGALRAEHFCDGALLDFLEKGAVEKWLKRLKEIDDAGHDPEKVLLKPDSVIDTEEIRRKWAEEWSETLEDCSEKWELVAYPVLADGTIALLFEHTEYDFIVHSRTDIETKLSRHMYRVLIYDPKTGDGKAQYRFTVPKGYAATVFFKNGNLFAALSAEGERKYTAVHIWPGADDASQISLGENVNCLAADSEGNLYVSAEYERNMGSFREVAFCVYYADGRRASQFMDDDTGVCDITLDGSENIWMLSDDGDRAVVYEKEALHAVSYAKGESRAYEKCSHRTIRWGFQVYLRWRCRMIRHGSMRGKTHPQVAA